MTAVCEFMKVTGNDPDGNALTITRGIWQTQGPTYLDTTCARAQSGDKDSRWKSAQAMSIIACVIGGFAILPLVCACGKKLRMSQVQSMSGGCMNACLFAGLTLLMKTSGAVCNVDGLSNQKCELGQGANVAIAATVLFFVASIAINCSFMVAAAQQAEENVQEKEKEEDVAAENKGEEQPAPDQSETEAVDVEAGENK